MAKEAQAQAAAAATTTTTAADSISLDDVIKATKPRSDEQATDVLQAALEEDGIEVILSARVQSVSRHGDQIVATVVPKDGGSSRELRLTHVLLASGRVPNVEALRLEQLGIERDRMGIVVDERMRTSVEGIWASGDVTGRHQFTPVAQYQARIAIDDMFGGDVPVADYSVLPTAIFTEPELAGVGLTEQEARQQGIEHEICVHDIKYVQRSSYKEQKRGLYKILYEPGSRRLLGLHVVAPNAGDIVQGFSLAFRLGGTVDDLAAMHHVFPTFGEGVRAAAEQAIPERVEMVEIVS